MTEEKCSFWPSGDNKVILAVTPRPQAFALLLGAALIRDRDELDWHDAVVTRNPRLGPILVLRHDHVPNGWTDIYVDQALDAVEAERAAIRHLHLTEDQIKWRLSNTKEPW